jgi:hypothetical protein
MEIRENRVIVRQPRFILDAVLICEGSDPGFAADHAAMQTWADDHAELLNSQSYDAICRIVSTEFPRVVTVEVTDPESGCGVIIHPWTGV